LSNLSSPSEHLLLLEMITFPFSTISVFFFLLVQSKEALCGPIPVTDKAILEGKKWASSLSLRPLSEQAGSFSQGHHQVLATLASMSTPLSQLHLEPDNKEAWGSSLSLGRGHKQTMQAPLHSPRQADTHPAIQEQWLPSPARPLVLHQPVELHKDGSSSHSGRDPTPHERAVNAQTFNTASSSTQPILSGQDASLSDVFDSNPKYFYGPERRKAISEGRKRSADKKRLEREVAKKASVSADMREGIRDGQSHTAAKEILAQLLDGYDSQNEKRTASHSRQAINRMMKDRSVNPVSHGSVWQILRSQFERTNPGRRIPNFLQSKGFLKGKTRLPYGLYDVHGSSSDFDGAAVKGKSAIQLQDGQPLSRNGNHKEGSSAATKRAREMEQSGPQSGHKIPRVVSGPDTSQAASRIEASRLRVAWNKELASEMLQKHEPRLLATSKEAALTQRELNSDISKHEINQRRIGNVKSFMRDMWIEKHSGQAIPRALLSDFQSRYLDRAVTEAQTASRLEASQAVSKRV
jgi:hypothetical protein